MDICYIFTWHSFPLCVTTVSSSALGYGSSLSSSPCCDFFVTSAGRACDWLSQSVLSALWWLGQGRQGPACDSNLAHQGQWHWFLWVFCNCWRNGQQERVEELSQLLSLVLGAWDEWQSVWDVVREQSQQPEAQERHWMPSIGYLVLVPNAHGQPYPDSVQWGNTVSWHLTQFGSALL